MTLVSGMLAQQGQHPRHALPIQFFDRQKLYTRRWSPTPAEFYFLRGAFFNSSNPASFKLCVTEYPKPYRNFYDIYLVY